MNQRGKTYFYNLVFCWCYLMVATLTNAVGNPSRKVFLHESFVARKNFWLLIQVFNFWLFFLQKKGELQILLIVIFTLRIKISHKECITLHFLSFCYSVHRESFFSLCKFYKYLYEYDWTLGGRVDKCPPTFWPKRYKILYPAHPALARLLCTLVGFIIRWQI